MLYGLVRPVKRSGSRIPQFVKRIPSDLLDRMRGRAFDIPLGEEYVRVVVGPTAESIRFSLRTADPATAKICQAIALAHLEKIFESLRTDTPIELTREQVAALAGEIYREWEGQTKVRAGVASRRRCLDRESKSAAKTRLPDRAQGGKLFRRTSGAAIR